MKAQLVDVTGSVKGELTLPALFDTRIREDLVAKYFEAERFNNKHKYATFSEAGKRHSASGTISHQRHKWASHYGKGVSRIPRKTMWRRGTQFYWIGAEVASTRGGRVAHPPRNNLHYVKINAKEIKLALNAAFAATAHKELIVQRYATIKEVKSAPFVIESLPKKTKELHALFQKLFPQMFHLVLKEKSVRPGKGKSRGRRYKSTAGVLVVTGAKETNSFKGIDVKSVQSVSITDLYPLGRLTVYTKAALEEMK